MALILVVDDSQDDLMLITSFLQGLGHHCRMANSGKHAMDVLSVELFDLIISDFQMADGDGVRLLNELKSVSDAPKCILITSDTSRKADYFLDQGASGFCNKPLAWTNLKSEIDRLL